MVTYQDYLNFVARQGDQDNPGRGMSEQDWNRLSPDRQWANVGGGLMLSNQDPRYGELAGLLGENDPDRYLLAGPQGDWDSSWMIDPNRMVQRNGVNVSTSGNETAASQAGNDFGIVQHGWMLPLAGAALGAMGAFGAEGAGAGLFEGAAAEGALSGGEGLFAGASATGELSGGPVGLFDGASATGELTEGLGVNPFDGATATGEVSGPGMFEGLLDSVMNNPLQTIGRGLSLYQMGRGLLNNNEPPPPSNNGDGKGGNGDGVTIPPFQRGQYQPNAITAAQLQNFQFARPRGM